MINQHNQPWIFEGQSIEFFIGAGKSLEQLEDKRLDHLSNQKKRGCLGYIGDGLLPSYTWIIITRYLRIPINQPV